MTKPSTQLDSEQLVTVNGVTLSLRSDKTAFCASNRTTYVTDIHVGKATSFQRFSIPIPESLPDDLARISRSLLDTSSERLIVLGDLIHSIDAVDNDVSDLFTAWRRCHRELSILNVRGNHDLNAGDPPKDWEIECLDGPVELDSLVLVHDPEEAPAEGYSLCGHIHPAVVIRGKGRGRARLPCFYVEETRMILPAFGSFTGSGRIQPSRGSRTFVVADNHVIEFGE